MMERKRKIRHYCMSIVCLTLFLVLSTCFIYLPKHTNMLGALAFLQKNNAVTIEEVSEDLDLAFTTPIEDEVGEYVPPYEFLVINQGNTSVKYQVSLFTGDSATRISQDAIHYRIKKNEEEYSEVRTLEEDGKIALSILDGLTSDRYAIKFWVHNNNDDSKINGKTFQGIVDLSVIK